MPLTSNVPKIVFTPVGVVIPQEDAILLGEQADIDDAFGGGLNPSLETPQGQLATSNSAIISDKNAEFAYIVNQMNPDFSDGAFQDGIGRIYFLTRKPAIPTSVSVSIGGNPGTVVPVGTIAKDINGNVYQNSGTVTIDITGAVPATFNNVVSGPIPCGALELTQIYQAIAGWDTIINASAGVTGQNVESRSEFETRRINSVALNANGTPQAIYANVFNVDGVLDVYVIDNPTDSIVNYGATNYPLARHSVYIAVVGGNDLEIATAIWNKKDLGCDYNGNTTVIVQDTSGYNFPYPEYSVMFERPTNVVIGFDVQIVNNPSLPSDIISQVKTAIFNRFNGLDGGQRERIGSDIFSSRYYGVVSNISPVVSIITIQINANAGPFVGSINMGIDQSPTLTESDITVTLV